MVLAALAGVAYALWKPRWAFVLVILLFPVKQLIQSYVPALRGYGQAGPNFVVASVAAFALAMRIFRGERPFRAYRNSGTVFTFLLYAMAVFGLAYTPSRDAATSLFLEGLPYQILLLGILPMLVKDAADLGRLMVGLLVAGTVISILVVANPSAAMAGGRLQLNVGVQSSVTGRGRSNPLAIAELGGVVAVTAALLKFERASMLLTAFRIGALLIGLGLAILSGSRGQVLAAVAVIVVFFPLARRITSFKQFIVTGGGLSLMGAAMYMTFKLFLTSETDVRWTGGSLNASVDDRIVRIMTLFNAWKDDPLAWIIGIGTNGFSAIWRGEGINASAYAHNVMAEALFELGIIGFIFFMGAAISAALSGGRLLRACSHDAGLRSASAALIAIGAYSFLLAIKQGCIISIPAPFHWWMVICYVWRAEALRARDESIADLSMDRYADADGDTPLEEPELGYRHEPAA